MAIDPQVEDVFPIAVLRKRVKGAPSRDTIVNYHQIGIVSKVTGRRVHLELLQVGEYWQVSKEAWWRFLAELNGATEKAR